MEYGISHSFEDETLEAKTLWELTKSPEQRIREALEWMVFIEQIRQVEPPDDDRSSFTSVQVLERPRG